MFTAASSRRGQPDHSRKMVLSPQIQKHANAFQKSRSLAGGTDLSVLSGEAGFFPARWRWALPAKSAKLTLRFPIGYSPRDELGVSDGQTLSARTLRVLESGSATSLDS
jgi:hypothetical protein